MAIASIAKAGVEAVPASPISKYEAEDQAGIVDKRPVRVPFEPVRRQARAILRQEITATDGIRLCRKEFRESLALAKTQSKEHLRKLAEESAHGVER